MLDDMFLNSQIRRQTIIALQTVIQAQRFHVWNENIFVIHSRQQRVTMLVT